MAVGLSLANSRGRGDAAGTGLVLDDNLLAQLAGELLGNDPQAGVGDPTRTEGNDDPDRLGRIVGLRFSAALHEAGQDPCGKQR